MKAKQKNFVVAAICAFACVLCTAFGFLASPLMKASAATTTGTFSQTGLTVSINGTETLTGVYTDPVNYSDTAENGLLVSASETLDSTKLTSKDAIVFTALYPYTTTKRAGDYIEYTVEYEDGKYVVTAINAEGNGETYIPVGGYVLSLAESSNVTLAIGSEVGVSGLSVVTRAVESDKGARVAIDLLNGTRTGYQIVYYDYDFGAKTGTNIYGSELTAIFDESTGYFKITGFRGFGMGDDSGSEIPDNGFVLSAHGEKYRAQLVENRRFAVGDQLSLKGFDYIRFGGEAVKYSYDYEYKNADDPSDEFNTNEGRWETESTPFAAYRGENQMIIYRSGWSYNGSTGTGTNVYGYEVAVDKEGNVVERGVNVSSIPEGGYVISGHGSSRDFIRSSIPLGACVTLDTTKREMSITTSLNSFFVNTKTTVEEIIAAAENQIKLLYDVDSETLNKKIAEANGLLTALEEVKTEIETKIAAVEKGELDWSEYDKTLALMSYNSKKLNVEALAYEILSLSSESRPVTARAVWHRPIEKNLSALEATLDTYKDTGINLVFVETFFNGYSMFKSEYVDYHKDFVNCSYGEYADYLTAFVALAKERGIEVHAWVEDFYVGLSDQITLLKNHPDWIMYNLDGTYYQKNEGGAYIFIDPTNKDVQDFLITYYTEIVETFPDIKGLNLDYIRYPVSTKTEDTGFTINSMKGFAATLGRESELTKTDVEGMIKQFKNYFLSSTATYKKWSEYRMQAVTDFVERVYKEIKLEKDILLSTAVFSSISSTQEQKKQDWQTWFKNGWIDIATPMAYFDSDTEVLSGVNQMITAAGTQCYYYTGLASSYRGLAAYENCYQIEASYLGGADGYVIFCSTQILGHDDVQELLRAGVNSKDAVLPHDTAYNVIKAYFDTVLDRAQRLYMPANGMTQAQYEALSDLFDEVLAMDMETSSDLDAIYDVLNKLTKTTGIAKYAKSNSALRIQATMKELCGLLDTKIQRLQLWETPETPDDSGSSDSVPSDSADTSDSDGGESKPAKTSGCGSSAGLSGLALGLTALGAALLLTKKRRNDNGK